jgi:hypothetical protein
MHIFEHSMSAELEPLVVNMNSLLTPVILVCIYCLSGEVTNAFCDSLAKLFDQMKLANMTRVIDGDINCSGTSSMTLDASLVDAL